MFIRIGSNISLVNLVAAGGVRRQKNETECVDSIFFEEAQEQIKPIVRLYLIVSPLWL